MTAGSEIGEESLSVLVVDPDVCVTPDAVDDVETSDVLVSLEVDVPVAVVPVPVAVVPVAVAVEELP